MVKASRRNFIFAFFIFCLLNLSLLTGEARSESFETQVPTGLIQLEDYPTVTVFLYVPDSYKPSRAYPFAIVLPGLSISGEGALREWQKLGTRMGYIVVVADILPRETDVPYRVDEFVLTLKKDIKRLYRIDEKRTYLVGVNDAAQYFGYLGTKYPEEFAGALLLNQSWAGPYWRIIHLKEAPAEQIPFFVSFNEGEDEAFEQAQQKAGELSAKGYPLHLEMLESGDDAFDTLAFKKRAFEWLNEKSESWEVVRAESAKTWKQKTKKWWKRNFSVK